MRLPNKQLVHDQKWDIQAQTIVHKIGYYWTFVHEQSSKMFDYGLISKAWAGD